MAAKHTSLILRNPHITEKGSYLSANGVYVFSVSRGANKKEIMEAIHEIYKVVPLKVRVATIPTKRVRTRGTNRTGRSTKGKKAYVYLKKGDTIEFA